MTGKKPELKLDANVGYALEFPYGPDPGWSGTGRNGEPRHMWTVVYNGLQSTMFGTATLYSYIQSAPLYGGTLTLHVKHIQSADKHTWEIYQLGEDRKTWELLEDPPQEAAAAGPGAPQPATSPAPPAEGLPPPGGQQQPPPAPSGDTAPAAKAGPTKLVITNLFAECIRRAEYAWGRQVEHDVLYKTAFSLWKEFLSRGLTTPDPLAEAPEEPGSGGEDSGRNPGEDPGHMGPESKSGVPETPGGWPGYSAPAHRESDAPPAGAPTEPQIAFRKICAELKRQINQAAGGKDDVYYTILVKYGWQHSSDYDGQATRTATECIRELTAALGGLER